MTKKGSTGRSRSPAITYATKAFREGDQYMIRMPPGLRDRIAARASENGRSISAEIVDAIEKHLAGYDRLTALEAFIERHREDIEAIPANSDRITQLAREVYELRGLFDGAMVRRGSGEGETKT